MSPFRRKNFLPFIDTVACVAFGFSLVPPCGAQADARVVRETKPAALNLDTTVLLSRSREPLRLEPPADGWRAGRTVSFRLFGSCTEDTSAAIDLEMPEHGHGPALMPEILRLALPAPVHPRKAASKPGPCTWRVGSVKLQMPGWWRATIVFTRGGRVADTALFNFEAH